MNQNTDKSTETPKVVNLFAGRKPAAEETNESTGEASKQEASKQTDSAAFLEAMRKNAENAERIRKERLKANQGVLKSYRIKN